MHIVLNGGCGFIGHNLALRLKATGHRVTVIDSLTVNNQYSLEEKSDEANAILQLRQEMLTIADVPMFRQDLTDYHLLSQIIAPLEPDAIVHLAAVAHLDRSHKDPINTIHNSLHTLENALDVARNTKSQPHFIYFSSSTVYGDFKGTVTETSPCNTQSVYGAVKYAGERIVDAYHHSFGMKTTNVRPSALYGPRCISGRVTQKFVERAAAGKPITIHGDGEIYQDFTYIDDLCQGVQRIIEQPDISNGQTFNLTYGQGRSLNELAEIVQREFDVPIKHIERDPLKPERGALSIARAQNLLGYKPCYPLQFGMGEYMVWYKDWRDKFLGLKGAA